MANEGVMQFSLGLATAGFLTKIGEAKGKLLEMVGAVASVDKIWEGFSGALESGAALKHLSDQTGESVRGLYQLQEAFKTVGLNSEELPNILIRMNQALSGIGRGTAAYPLFKRLGLDPDSLKGMDAASQITSISSALAKLDKQSAIGVSSQLFGMETGARPFLQIIGSIKEFQAAMEDAKSEGNIFASMAPMAARLDAVFVSIKGHVEAAFASLLVGFGPALEAGAAFVNNISKGLMKVAQQISGFSRNLAEAFREGKIGELLNLTFAASVEFLTNMLISTLGSGEFWSGIFNNMVGSFVTAFGKILEIIATIGQVLMATLDTAFQKLYEAIGKTALGKKIGLGGYKAQTFSQNLDEEKRRGSGGMEGVRAITGAGESYMRLGLKETTDALKRAFANAGGAEQDKLKNFWAGIKSRTPAMETPEDKSTPGNEVLGNEKYTYKPEFSALEKMGFVGSGANPSQEYARRTADGVGQMVTLLQTTVSLLSDGAGQTNQI